jgi:putative flippase GtrA
MRRDRAKAVSGQFGRFLVVGASNTLLSFGVFLVLSAAGLPAALATAIAFAAGAVNGYVWNRRWTFAARDSLRARLLYVAVQGGGLLATSALVWALIHLEGFGRMVGYLAAVPPITMSMFVLNRAWTFGVGPGSAH